MAIDWHDLGGPFARFDCLSYPPLSLFLSTVPTEKIRRMESLSIAFHRESLGDEKLKDGFFFYVLS